MTRHLAAAVAGAVLALGSFATSGCGPKCEPPTGIDICTSPDPSCIPEGAQICPRLNPIPFCDRVVGDGPATSPFPGAYEYDLIIDNYGADPLTITDIRVVGDDRCALKGLTWAPMGEPIPSLGSVTVQMFYDPPDAGDDSLFIEIDSNAENFALFPVNICGTGILPPAMPMNCLFCTEKWTAGMPESMCP
jgi:hypothetical protein